MAEYLGSYLDSDMSCVFMKPMIGLELETVVSPVGSLEESPFQQFPSLLLHASDL